jgi:transcriptional regulator with XRE-family HTH domain
MSIPPVTNRVRAMSTRGAYDAGMVTQIRHKAQWRRLYLKEHREFYGVTPEAMAGRLGIDRVSVHRWEREQQRMNPAKQLAYAEALGIEPAALWRPPDAPSVDELLAKAPEDLRRKAAEMVAILVKTGTSD